MADQEHLDVLLRGPDAWNTWRSQSLSFVPDLSHTDLSSVDLDHADLQRANLVGSRLAGSSLLRLSQADLRNADLTTTSLSGSALDGADLRGAHLDRTTNIRGVMIWGAWCDESTQWPAGFDAEQRGVIHVLQAYTRFTNRRGADLRHLDFSTVNLAGCVAEGANLREVQLDGSYIVGGNLVSANLQGASLRGTNLCGALLRRADLTGADLSGARMRGVNLIETDLTGANMSGANLEGAIMRPTTLTNANLTNADLTDALIDGVTLRGVDLSGAALLPARFVKVLFDDETTWPAGFDADTAGAHHMKDVSRADRTKTPTPAARTAKEALENLSLQNGKFDRKAIGLSRAEGRILLKPAEFDGFTSDPDIRKATKALVNGKWTVANELMDVRAADAWLFVSDLTGDHSDVAIGAFEMWANQGPSARSLALLGKAQTRAAWEIRGTSRAKNVDPNAWGSFHGGLRVAEQTLQAATQLDSSSADPWVAMLTTARGLQMSNDEARARFQNAHSRHPFRPDACTQMLQCLCAKWSGSHEEMFAFARWVETYADAGSAAKATLFIAHFEYFHNQGNTHLVTYYSEDDVATELEAAAASFLDAIPDRPEPQHLLPLNWMVQTLSPRNKHSALLIHEVIRRIDGRLTSAPWTSGQGSATSQYEAARNGKLALASQFI